MKNAVTIFGTLLVSLTLFATAKAAANADGLRCNSIFVEDLFAVQVIEEARLRQHNFDTANPIAVLDYMSSLDSVFEHISTRFSDWMTRSNDIVATDAGYAKAGVLIQDLRKNLQELSALTAALNKNLAYAKMSKWKRSLIRMTMTLTKFGPLDEVTKELLTCSSKIHCLSHEIPAAEQDLKVLYGRLVKETELMKSFETSVVQLRDDLVKQTRQIPGASIRVEQEFKRIELDVLLARQVITNAMRALLVDLESLQALKSGPRGAAQHLKFILAQDPNPHIAQAIRVLTGLENSKNAVAKPQDAAISIIRTGLYDPNNIVSQNDGSTPILSELLEFKKLREKNVISDEMMINKLELLADKYGWMSWPEFVEFYLLLPKKAINPMKNSHFVSNQVDRFGYTHRFDIEATRGEKFWVKQSILALFKAAYILKVKSSLEKENSMALMSAFRKFIHDEPSGAFEAYEMTLTDMVLAASEGIGE